MKNIVYLTYLINDWLYINNFTDNKLVYDNDIILILMKI